MAKKKRKPEDESPKPSERPKKARPKAGRRAKPPIPPRTAMEGLMKQLLGVEDDPVRAQADALLHQAFRADDPDEVSALARKALEVWPDCADAYVLLAEQARGP